MAKHMIAVALAALMAAPAFAGDLKLRNVQLVDAGHVTAMVGTVVNTSDHVVKGGYLDVEVSKNNQVIARETVEVPDMGAGQAWRIWQPVEHGEPAQAAHVHARDPHVSVAAAVVPYPGTLVAE